MPAENSSKYILNVLNDDCIQEILRRLLKTVDFFNAAESCHRFLANTLQCYPSKFKSLEANELTCLQKSLDFLQIFGQLIRTLGFDVGDNLELISDGAFNMIADHCGETLVEMNVEVEKNTTVNFSALSKFKALEIIRIRSEFRTLNFPKV